MTKAKMVKCPGCGRTRQFYAKGLCKSCYYQGKEAGAPSFNPKDDSTLSFEDKQILIKDPILAAQVIFGIDLAPFEVNRINAMWEKKFYLDSSGYDTAKSFSIALVAALRGCLLEDRIQGVISATFGQVKLIFEYFERWYFTCPKFRAQFRNRRGQGVVRNPDLHIVKLKGQSDIRGVPPDIIRDAKRLRSERWNDGYFDEWVHYPKQETIDTVMNSRITRHNKNQHDPILQNHLAYLSSPTYKFDVAYKRVKFFLHKVFVEGDPKYDIQSYNYNDVPELKHFTQKAAKRFCKTCGIEANWESESRRIIRCPQCGKIEQEWGWIIDRDVFEQARATLPPVVFAMEWEGEWQEGGEGIYSPEKIKNIRLDMMEVELRGVEDFTYVMGVDVARSLYGKGDDFTISVLKLNGEFDDYVYQFKANGLSADEMAYEIHLVMELFPNIALFVMDPGGGGQFLASPLAAEKISIPGGEYKVKEKILETSSFEMDGKKVLCFFSRGAQEIASVWGSMAGDDVLVNKAHLIMQGRIENERLRAPKTVDEFMEKAGKLIEKKDSNEKLKVLKNIDNAFNELIGIEVRKDKDGMPVKTARGQFVFRAKKKKDSAYSLIYANVASELFRRIQEMGKETMAGGTTLTLIEEVDIQGENELVAQNF